MYRFNPILNKEDLDKLSDRSNLIFLSKNIKIVVAKEKSQEEVDDGKYYLFPINESGTFSMPAIFEEDIRFKNGKLKIKNLFAKPTFVYVEVFWVDGE
jgi:hypothetical protein